MNRWIRSLALVTCAAVALAGCSMKQPVYDGRVAAHSVDQLRDAPKAVFANQIPVFPGARLTDAMGSQSNGDEADPYTEGTSWWLEFRASTARVVAFYDAALPNAVRSVNDADGSIQWTLVPAGGKRTDLVSVRVKGHQLRISEDVKAGQRRSN